MAQPANIVSEIQSAVKKFTEGMETIDARLRELRLEGANFLNAYLNGPGAGLGLAVADFTALLAAMDAIDTVLDATQKTHRKAIYKIKP